MQPAAPRARSTVKLAMWPKVLIWITTDWRRPPPNEWPLSCGQYEGYQPRNRFMVRSRCVWAGHRFHAKT